MGKRIRDRNIPGGLASNLENTTLNKFQEVVRIWLEKPDSLFHHTPNQKQNIPVTAAVLETVWTKGCQLLPRFQIFWSKIYLSLKKILGYEIPIDVKVLYSGIIKLLIKTTGIWVRYCVLPVRKRLQRFGTILSL